jgi:tetratricopeptide (TPR) repeat protein
VLYSWNPFAVEYARLAQGLRVPSTPSAADDSATSRAFASQLLQGSVPIWLRALPYRVPPMSRFENPWVLVLEVVPDQTAKEAATRLATFCLALNDEETAVRQLDAALALDRDYVPALVTLARVQVANPKRGDVRATVQRIQNLRGADSLALEDNIGLATLYMQIGDTARARIVATRAITQADEKSIRKLPWDYTTANFVLLARKLNLATLRPAIVEFAYAQLDPAVQAQLPK